MTPRSVVGLQNNFKNINKDDFFRQSSNRTKYDEKVNDKLLDAKVDNDKPTLDDGICSIDDGICSIVYHRPIFWTVCKSLYPAL